MTTLRRLERLRPVALALAAHVIASVAIRAQQAPTVPPPADWQATVAKEIAQSEYQFSVRADGAVSAPNRAQDLRSTVTPAGVEITSRVEGGSQFKVTLNLVGHGRGARIVTADQGTLVQDERGASIARGAIREWYVNDERGLEQGFTLASRPDGSKGKAALELALGGNVLAYPDPTGQSILFKNAKGEPELRYAELRVADAAGRELPARMVVRPGVVRIEFDDARAVYPVTVDPLAASPAWTAESDQANAQLGVSVATAGDVNGDGYADVIVGAPLYGGGRVFVYLGSASGLATSAAWTASAAQGALGYSVATAGDVNGDGYSDVIVGAPSVRQRPESTRAARSSTSARPSGSRRVRRGRRRAIRPGANFGCSVATAGDVNGDGYADVIVGALLLRHRPDSTTGRAFVYLGSAAGLVATRRVDRRESTRRTPNFGTSVATAGDVNGDGYADVIVGAPDYDNGQTDEGRAFVYLGSASGLAATPAWTAESNQASALLRRTRWPRRGTSTATATPTSSSAPSATTTARADEGRAFVYLGSAVRSRGQSRRGRRRATRRSPIRRLGGDRRGRQRRRLRRRHRRGAYFTTTARPTRDAPSSTSARPRGWRRPRPGRAESDQASAQFGISVGDGGGRQRRRLRRRHRRARLYDNGQTDEGRAYRVPTARRRGPRGERRRGRRRAIRPARSFGVSVATAGDVNGDGYSRRHRRAPDYDNGETDEGRAFVYSRFGRGLATIPAWTAEGNHANANFGCLGGDGGGRQRRRLRRRHRRRAQLQRRRRRDGRPRVRLPRLGFGPFGRLRPGPRRRIWQRSTSAGRWQQPGTSTATATPTSSSEHSTSRTARPTRAGVRLPRLGSGLATNAAWTAEGDQGGAEFGFSVATAGDVNGDGYSDVIVGAHFYSNRRIRSRGARSSTSARPRALRRALRGRPRAIKPSPSSANR